MQLRKLRQETKSRHEPGKCLVSAQQAPVTLLWPQRLGLRRVKCAHNQWPITVVTLLSQFLKTLLPNDSTYKAPESSNPSRLAKDTYFISTLKRHFKISTIPQHQIHLRARNYLRACIVTSPAAQCVRLNSTSPSPAVISG